MGCSSIHMNLLSILILTWNPWNEDNASESKKDFNSFEGPVLWTTLHIYDVNSRVLRLFSSLDTKPLPNFQWRIIVGKGLSINSVKPKEVSLLFWMSNLLDCVGQPQFITTSYLKVYCRFITSYLKKKIDYTFLPLRLRRSPVMLWVKNSWLML